VIVKPRRLSPGDLVGVVAPSSPAPGDQLERGMSALREMGFRVETAPHVRDRWGYLAGTDESRAADLTAMFRRDDISAVICARGGYGAARMADLVDWECVRAHPKVFIGYSDITTLQLAMEARASMVTFHGPMVTTLGHDGPDAMRSSLLRAVTSPDPIGPLDDPARPTRCLASGHAHGRIVGGCLSMLCAAMGTPYAPDFADRIVVLEDTDEAIYRADRMLAQLRAGGLLDRAAGFIVGDVTNRPSPDPAEGRHDEGLTLDDLWIQYLVPLGKPVIVGFPFGHVNGPLTIPLGCMAEMDADEGSVIVTEAAVL